MKNIWMISESEVVTSEPIDAPAEQTTTENGTVQNADPNAGGQTAKPQGNPMLQFVIIGLIFVMLYFVMFRGPKKKQAQQKQMVSSLNKNDRVQTIGGIVGTVIEVGDDEVTLKVDEANNTKMRFSPSAIARVIDKK